VLHVDIDNVHYMVVHFGGYNTVFSHPYSQNPKKKQFWGTCNGKHTYSHNFTWAAHKRFSVRGVAGISH